MNLRVDVDGTEYRVNTFEATAVGGSVDVALLMLPDTGTRGPTAGDSLWAAAAFIGFLILAFVLRGPRSPSRLQSEIQRLLEAARRLGGGDFSVAVPAEDDDEFGELGKEFNSMARQLEARLEDLQRERGRLQEAIRRVGESFAAGLDRRPAARDRGADGGRRHRRLRGASAHPRA